MTQSGFAPGFGDLDVEKHCLVGSIKERRGSSYVKNTCEWCEMKDSQSTYMGELFCSGGDRTTLVTDNMPAQRWWVEAIDYPLGCSEWKLTWRWDRGMVSG